MFFQYGFSKSILIVNLFSPESLHTMNPKNVRSFLRTPCRLEVTILSDRWNFYRILVTSNKIPLIRKGRPHNVDDSVLWLKQTLGYVNSPHETPKPQPNPAPQWTGSRQHEPRKVKAMSQKHPVEPVATPWGLHPSERLWKGSGFYLFCFLFGMIIWGWFHAVLRKWLVSAQKWRQDSAYLLAFTAIGGFEFQIRMLKVFAVLWRLESYICCIERFVRRSPVFRLPAFGTAVRWDLHTPHKHIPSHHTKWRDAGGPVEGRSPGATTNDTLLRWPWVQRHYWCLPVLPTKEDHKVQNRLDHTKQPTTAGRVKLGFRRHSGLQAPPW